MQLCGVVRETGFAIHRCPKHRHLEKVYENALAHRLRKLGLDGKQQYPLKVYDEDSTLIGDYSADLFVDNRLTMYLFSGARLAQPQQTRMSLCGWMSLQADTLSTRPS